MSEQEQVSQLSALFDGELPSGQADMVVRRTLRDPSMRAAWERYALIGACMRGEPVHSGGERPSVADHVRASLVAEPELIGRARVGAAISHAASAAADRYSRFGRGALGGAIAAGVALVSILLVRGMEPVAGAGGDVMLAAVQDVPPSVTQPAGPVVAAAVQAPVQQADDPGAAPSYTTPIDSSRVSVPLDRSLVSYVVAHSEVASSAYRLGPASVVMGGGYDPTLGAVEMTEAEIGARH